MVTLLIGQVLERGVGLTTQSDSELITQMLCLTPPQGEPDGPDWKARIEHLMTITPLSYALVIMHKVFKNLIRFSCVKFRFMIRSSVMLE